LIASDGLRNVPIRSTWRRENMKKLMLAAAALVAMAGAALADPLEGMWKTAPDDNGNSGHIQVVPCGAALCGTLVKAFGPTGEEIPSDIIGRLLIWDTVPDGDGQYSGRVYSPDRDAEYNSKLVLTGDRLSVSGCRLGFCREGGVWSRVN
jgi:uncharacterized protein (DUF2147 family)